MEVSDLVKESCLVRFGVSTQLYHSQRLSRAHLEEIVSFGFDTIEVVATRTHIDYHDPAALDELAGWLGQTGLRLHSIHAPVTESVSGRTWGSPFSNASPLQEVRDRAVAEARAALELARRVPVETLIVHPGLPDSLVMGPDNDASALRRSVEEIAEAAAPLGVRVALENIPGALATPEAVVAEAEAEAAPAGLGTCLDVGHAHLMAGVVDAAETMSGHLVATHVHDNHGAWDEHLPPYEGGIDWDAALMALQKIGYEGVLMFEVAPNGAPTPAVLARVRQAASRLDAAMRSWS